MSSTKRLEVYLSESTKPNVPDTGFFSKDNSMLVGTVIFAALCLLLICFVIIKKTTKRIAARPSFSMDKKHWLKNTIPILAVVLSLGFLGFLSSRMIFAEIQTSNLAIETPALTTLDADILGSERIAYVKDTVTLTEDAAYGYTLYLHANNTKLVNTQNPDAFFSSQSVSGILGNNTFGFSTEAPDDNSLDTKIWNPIHLKPDRDILKVSESDTPVHAGDTVDIYYAVRSSDLEAGTYGIDLTYTAVSNQKPWLQDMTQEYCANVMEEGVLYNFIDKRDNKEYGVRKYADGNCWMVSNLDLDLSAETTLTSEDTDIPMINAETPGEWTPKNSTSTTDGEKWGYHDLDMSCMVSNPAECPTYSYDSGEQKDGNYYNIYAATAGTAAVSSDGFEDGGASICPKGWYIANRYTYDNLLKKYLPNEDPYSEIADYLNAIPGLTDSFTGIYDGTGIFSEVTERFGLAKQINGIQFSGYQAIPDGLVFEFSEGEDYYRFASFEDFGSVLAMSFNGNSVRCVANFKQATLKYDTNTLSEVTNFPETIIEDVEGHKATAIISSLIPERADDYTFVGWSTVQDTSENDVEYYPGGTIELKSASTTLYAIWRAPTPKAILGQNNNLNFLYDSKKYHVGDTYQDNYGTTEIKAIQLVNNPSGNRGGAVTVNFDESFKKYKPTNTASWFAGAPQLTTVTHPENLDMSNVVDTANMFYEAGANATSFALDASSWDMSNVKNASSMFCKVGTNANSISLDLTGWGMGNLKVAQSMFSNLGGSKATTLEISGLSGWDTGNVENMGSMFADSFKNVSSASLGIENWDTGKVQYMSNMFNGFGSNIDDFRLDLSKWDTKNVINTELMFRSSGTDSDSFFLDLSNWNTEKITTMREMFASSGQNSDTWEIKGISNWNTKNVQTMRSMFRNAGAEAESFSLNLSGWNVGKLTDSAQMFERAGINSDSFSVDLSDWNSASLNSMFRMFSYAGENSTAKFSVDLTGLDTSNVTAMDRVFEYAGMNTSDWAIKGIEGWNTENVRTMSIMFNNAGYKAETFSFDLTGWNVQNVENITYMFESAGGGAANFSLDLSGWDTGKVTSLFRTFKNAGHDAQVFLLDVTGWNTENVTTLEETFSAIGNGMIKPITGSDFTFKGISTWNTGNVTNMAGTFRAIARKTSEPYALDLSSWDTSKVTNMTEMFKSDDMIKTIYVSDGWNVDNVTESTDMFDNVRRLVGSNGTGWSTTNPTDKTYAHIDTADNPGYFTDIADKTEEDKEFPLGVLENTSESDNSREMLLLAMFATVAILLIILLIVKRREDSSSEA